MNAADIDKLSGRELKIAIAEVLGYTLSEHPAGGNWLFAPDGSGIIHIDDLPDWPTDIAAAWELDGEGWEWIFNEYRDQRVIPLLRLSVMTYDTVNKKGPYAAEVLFSDFPTKSAAYARARCEAWLKAREAANA